MKKFPILGPDRPSRKNVAALPPLSRTGAGKEFQDGAACHPEWLRNHQGERGLSQCRISPPTRLMKERSTEWTFLRLSLGWKQGGPSNRTWPREGCARPGRPGPLISQDDPGPVGEEEHDLPSCARLRWPMGILGHDRGWMTPPGPYHHRRESDSLKNPNHRWVYRVLGKVTAPSGTGSCSQSQTSDPVSGGVL